MQLLKYLLTVFINVNCKELYSNISSKSQAQDSTQFTQQLLFGSTFEKKKKQHWCDVKITPEVKITEITIFKKVGTGKDTAIPNSSVIIKNSPITPNAFRIDIPDLFLKDIDSKYTFQFKLLNGTLIYSEAFAFSKRTDLFCLASGIKENRFFTKENLILASLSILVAIVLIVIGIVLKRKICAKKQNL